MIAGSGTAPKPQRPRTMRLNLIMMSMVSVVEASDYRLLTPPAKDNGQAKLVYFLPEGVELGIVATKQEEMIGGA